MSTNYEIVKMQTYKGYLFLLSIVNFSLGTAAFWSTHDVSNFNGAFSLADMKKIFQREHNKQVRKMIRDEEKREPEEFRIKTIEDKTKDLIDGV